MSNTVVKNLVARLENEKEHIVVATEGVNGNGGMLGIIDADVIADVLDEDKGDWTLCDVDTKTAQRHYYDAGVSESPDEEIEEVVAFVRDVEKDGHPTGMSEIYYFKKN